MSPFEITIWEELCLEVKLNSLVMTKNKFSSFPCIRGIYLTFLRSKISIVDTEDQYSGHWPVLHPDFLRPLLQSLYTILQTLVCYCLQNPVYWLGSLPWNALESWHSLATWAGIHKHLQINIHLPTTLPQPMSGIDVWKSISLPQVKTILRCGFHTAILLPKVATQRNSPRLAPCMTSILLCPVSPILFPIAPGNIS